MSERSMTFRRALAVLLLLLAGCEGSISGPYTIYRLEKPGPFFRRTAIFVERVDLSSAEIDGREMTEWLETQPPEMRNAFKHHLDDFGPTIVDELHGPLSRYHSLAGDRGGAACVVSIVVEKIELPVREVRATGDGYSTGSRYTATTSYSGRAVEVAKGGRVRARVTIMDRDKRPIDDFAVRLTIDLDEKEYARDSTGIDRMGLEVGRAVASWIIQRTDSHWINHVRETESNRKAAAEADGQ